MSKEPPQQCNRSNFCSNDRDTKMEQLASLAVSSVTDRSACCLARRRISFDAGAHENTNRNLCTSIPLPPGHVDAFTNIEAH